MEKEHNFTTTDIFAEHLTLTFSLDNDTKVWNDRLHKDLVLEHYLDSERSALPSHTMA